MSIEYTPKPYQLDALTHICAHPGAGLFAKPGMGKTSTTLAAFTVLRDAGAVKRMLVVAPLRPCHKVWPAEIEKWSDFNGLTYSVLHGKLKAQHLKDTSDVYIINYEGLKWFETAMPAGWMKDTMLVLDESTKIKSTKAVRTDIATKLARQAARCVILTGTPRPNSLQDIFAQIRALDGGQRLGRFITHFRKTYFEEIPQRGGYSLWLPKEGADEAVIEKISDICLTLDYEGNLDMPELIENVINVDLPSSARDAYEQFAQEFFLAIDSGEVTAANAAVVGMKLRQIVGGGVYSENVSDPQQVRSRSAIEFETNKLEALRDLIEEQNGQPLLVAVGFLHEVERIRAYLGVDFGPLPYLGGGASVSFTNQTIDDWNLGNIPVLLVHPTSVAHGLNLQAGGSAVCWYTLTWNLEEHIQLNGRVWRQGQTANVVTIHYLIAEGTIDEQVLEALRAKDRKQASLVSALVAGRKAAPQQKRRKAR